MANTQEELLNGELARLLKDRGLDAEAEQQHIDVLVNVGGLRVAIEAKNGQRANNRRDARQHADRRIAEGRAEVSALSLDPEWVALVRSELAREPSVTGKRYAQ